MKTKIPTVINDKPVVTFDDQMNSLAPEIMTECAGIEIPKATWKSTRRYLRKFKRDGILILDHDDGPGSIVRYQLEKIAGSVGINYFSARYSLVMWDEDRFPYVDCSKCEME